MNLDFLRKRLITGAGGTAPGFNPDELDGMAKWAGAGFVALGSVLTFFGVKEGVLDRLLRTDATAALWIFILLGIGVVASVMAPTVTSTSITYVSWVVVGVVVMGCITIWLLPDIEGQDANEYLWLLTLLLVAAAGAIFVIYLRTPIPLTAALLVAAVAATSFGLYGGAKLSVLSKRGDVDVQVAAKLATVDGTQVVAIDVDAVRRDGNEDLTVKVFGKAIAATGDIGDAMLLGRAHLTANALGEIDSSLALPVNPAVWHEISVATCLPPCEQTIEQALLQGRGPSRLPRVGGSLSRVAGDRTAVTANISSAAIIMWLSRLAMPEPIHLPGGVPSSV